MNDFETHRGLLFTIAYRMTGSAADAEDLVQDAWVRYASADLTEIRDVKAYLVTIVSRLALDRLKSAQKQREEYVGEWLPEPVFTGADADPYARATREEEIGIALLRALERLSAQERAVLLLYEVLDHDHNEIAELLGITPAASRQILHRAKARVAADRPRFAPPKDEQRRLVESFLGAILHGDVASLRNVLASDVVSIADGGGRTLAAPRPVVGLDAVARLYVTVARKFGEGLESAIEEVNGAPAVIGRRDGVITAVLSFRFEEGRICEIWNVLNPDKLEFLQRQRAATG